MAGAPPRAPSSKSALGRLLATRASTGSSLAGARTSSRAPIVPNRPTSFRAQQTVRGSPRQPAAPPPGRSPRGRQPATASPADNHSSGRSGSQGNNSRPSKRARIDEQPEDQAPAPELGSAGPTDSALAPPEPNGPTPAAAASLRDAAAKAAQAAAWVAGAAKEAARAAEALAAATREAMPLMADKTQAEEASKLADELAKFMTGASNTGMELTVQSQDAMVRAAHLGEQCSWQPLGNGGSPPQSSVGEGQEEARRRWASDVLGQQPKAPAPDPEPLDLGPQGTITKEETAMLEAEAEAEAANHAPQATAANPRKGPVAKRPAPGAAAAKRHPLKTLNRMTGCKLAEWRSERSLLAAARTGRRIRDTDVTFVLDAWKFRRNDKRINVIPDGEGFVSSEMLGLVSIRAYRKLVVARQSTKFPNVTKLLCQYLYDNPPPGLPRGTQFPFTTVCINKDYAAKRHRDNNNCGLSIVRALGNFKGGRLKYWPEDPGPRMAPDVNKLDNDAALVLDVRGRSVALDSTKAHEVEPFQGRRYSLVYFTIPWVDQTSQDIKATLKKTYNLEIKPHTASEETWQCVRSVNKMAKLGSECLLENGEKGSQD